MSAEAAARAAVATSFPALAAVLGALTRRDEWWWRNALAGRRGPLHMDHEGVSVFVPRASGRPGITHMVGWSAADARDAQEILVARGLLPDGWCDATQRGWYCDACDNYGTWRIATTMYPHGTREVPCERCFGGPRVITDAVAVGALGAPATQRAEQLVREALHVMREHGCPQPTRVAWRVGYRMLSGDFAWRLRGSYGVQRNGAASFPGVVAGPVRAVAELWRMGLALDGIDDAVRIVVPSVGDEP